MGAQCPAEPLPGPPPWGVLATALGTRTDATSHSLAGSGCKTRKEGRKRVCVCACVHVGWALFNIHS